MARASRSKTPEFDPSELQDLILTPAVGTGVGSHLLSHESERSTVVMSNMTTVDNRNMTTVDSPIMTPVVESTETPAYKRDSEETTVVTPDLTTSSHVRRDHCSRDDYSSGTGRTVYCGHVYASLPVADRDG